MGTIRKWLILYDAREALRTETATLIDIDTTDEEEEADPFADIEEDEYDRTNLC